MPAYHEPVLRAEALRYLLTDRDGIYVDATVGGGGHAEAICGLLGTQGKLIGFDADGDAIAEAEKRLVRYSPRVTLIRENFRFIRNALAARAVTGVAGILFDLGVSSFQLDTAEKGFSFRFDDPLDMRMDRRGGVRAAEIVNAYTEARLAELLRTYGEEREARRIARRIVRERPLKTTGDLRRTVVACVGERFATKSLARVFQALRIEVNGELASLTQALAEVPDLLRSGGRCVVIAYHSLEDRIVKEFFRAEAASRIRSTHAYLPDQPRVPRLEVITKKPVTPDETECARNPRARSAKLRAAARI